eukprot:14950425-Alexandrium_andersonii.AAC.1
MPAESRPPMPVRPAPDAPGDVLPADVPSPAQQPAREPAVPAKPKAPALPARKRSTEPSAALTPAGPRVADPVEPAVPL